MSILNGRVQKKKKKNTPSPIVQGWARHSIQRQGGQPDLTDSPSGLLFQARGCFALGLSGPASLTFSDTGLGPRPLGDYLGFRFSFPNSAIPALMSSVTHPPPTCRLGGTAPMNSPPLALAASLMPMPQRWIFLSGNAIVVLKHESLGNSI